MAVITRNKTLFINKELQVNSKLINDIRLSRGLSRFQLALEVQLAPQTIRRFLSVDSDPRPSTVKKIGEYLGIAPQDWYVQREENKTAAQ